MCAIISAVFAMDLYDQHGKRHGYSKTPCSTIMTPPPSSTTCTSTLCADYIDSCGQTYGGCYPVCSGYATPSFTDPGCPASTPTATTSTLNTTTSFCEMECWKGVDACGHFIGDCASYYDEPHSSVVTCTPYCSITPTPTVTRISSPSCVPVFNLMADGCNNVYGPGCWT